jgi:D-glycero-D-manno-heptose 1,7-bisphosphate phosphatase
MAVNILTTKAVFLDKDGTLIENVPYNVDPSKIKLAEGAAEALKLLHGEGYRLIVVSNQSGVARGLFKERDLKVVEEYLKKLLAKAGVSLSGFYYCPHHPDGRLRDYAVPCICRKPRPGMLFQAARDHEINLASSWIVGDILDDVEAGRRAECNTILLNNGNETEWTLTPYRRPHYTAPNLLEAARIIKDLQKPNSMGDMKTSSFPTNLGASL